MPRSVGRDDSAERRGQFAFRGGDEFVQRTGELGEVQRAVGDAAFNIVHEFPQRLCAHDRAGRLERVRDPTHSVGVSAFGGVSQRSAAPIELTEVGVNKGCDKVRIIEISEQAGQRLLGGRGCGFVGAGIWGGTLKMLANHAGQVIECDGLDDEPVHAGIDAPLGIAGHRSSGDAHDRDPAGADCCLARSPATRGLESVHVGEVPVHLHEVELLGLERPQRVDSGWGDPVCASEAFELSGGQQLVYRVVLYYQNVG